MLIAEELFLLLRRDDGKVEDMYAYNGFGLAAAVIADLVIADRVALDDDGADDPRVRLVDSAPHPHPVLAVAVERMRKQDGKRLSSLLSWGELELLGETAESLAAQGVVEVRESRIMGLVPARYPVVDLEPERRVRERLVAVLDGDDPGVRDGTLLAILHGLKVVPTVLPDEWRRLGADRIADRIGEVCSSEVARGVGDVVQVMNAALIVNAAILPITGPGSS